MSHELPPENGANHDESLQDHSILQKHSGESLAIPALGRCFFQLNDPAEAKGTTSNEACAVHKFQRHSEDVSCANPQMKPSGTVDCNILGAPTVPNIISEHPDEETCAATMIAEVLAQNGHQVLLRGFNKPFNKPCLIEASRKTCVVRNSYISARAWCRDAFSYSWVWHLASVFAGPRNSHGSERFSIRSHTDAGGI